MTVSLHTRQNTNLLIPQVKFNNIDIAYKSEFKSLGIYITVYDMKYACNVTKLKPEQVCYIINSLNEVMSLHAIRSIYFVNFHTLLRYGLYF